MYSINEPQPNYRWTSDAPTSQQHRSSLDTFELPRTRRRRQCRDLLVLLFLSFLLATVIVSISIAIYLVLSIK